MKNPFIDIMNLEEGTYLVAPEGVVDYAERWSYGYIVGVRELSFSDLKVGTLFGIWKNEDGVQEIDLVRHVAALQDAKKLAADLDQTAIYDLRDRKVIDV